MARFSTSVHIALFSAIAACAGEKKPAPDSAAASAAGFRVALLTPGPISDRSRNGGAYEGLLRIRDSLGATVSHIQTRTPAEFEENFRQYGRQNYNLVFGHGFEFQDAAVRVAPEFPRTIFITTSGNTVRPNVSGIVFGFEDASYEAGVLAGLLTRSNVIGLIGGTGAPSLKSSFAAFALGVKSVNPRAQLLTSYIGNWDDASAGKEQALAQIGRKADIIFQNADAAGLGIFQAAREKPGVLVFGSNSNQNTVAPEVVIGSVVIDLPKALMAVAREVREQRFTPRVIRLGTPAQMVSLVLNPALADRIPDSARQRLDSVHTALVTGVRPDGLSKERIRGTMTDLADIAFALDGLLRTSDVPDYPNALNGIQVAHRGPVRRIAAAVDLSVRTVEATIDGDANLLMVHHGLFWGGLQPLIGAFRERVRLLIEHDIAVYASHLPLDAHPEHGNNILLARTLGLTPTGGFALNRGQPIGVSGSDDTDTLELVERAKRFASQHETSVRTSRVPAKHRTRRWGLCTGAGASADTLHEAVTAGLDTMIVGEGPHWTAVDAPDSGVVIIYAGHYATETLGIKSVAAWTAERFQLPWFFIDASTGF